MDIVTQYWLAMFSEFIGTAILVLLGNGVCAATSLKRMNANQSGKWIVIAMGWGFAVFVAATISAAMGGGGMLNPAVLIMQSIGASKDLPAMIDGTIPASGMFAMGVGALQTTDTAAVITLTFFIVLIFELLGAIFGQIVLNFINFKFLKDKENDLLTIRGSHCTAPAYKNKEERAAIFNFSYEFMGTLILLAAILAFNKLPTGAQADVQSGGFSLGALSNLAVTFVIMSIGLSLGSATGYAINPARDLMPRIVFASFVNIFRKEDKVANIADWGYSWVPVAGPMVAGVIIGLFSLI
ncbi:MAG: aquaporin family protein [Malacoplasma sp.]|nr:aquaporin family protein [Malacoplasma sp.]MDE6082674.1 aquaporin family protein [Malacoplasma sp.]MDE6562704.1 aquaporin family protein [Malacoplasma sp.]